MLLDIKYVECPHCKEWFLTDEIISYSQFGNSDCWSDGKCLNNNLSEYSFLPFTKCESCNNFFWFDNARELKDYEIKDYLKNIKQKKENTFKNLTISEFLEKNRENYINNSQKLNLQYPPPNYGHNIQKHIFNDFLILLNKTKNIDIEKEIYLRIKIWQHINDLVRRKNRTIHYLSSINNLKNILKFINKNIKLRLKNRRIHKKYRKFKQENMSILLKLLETIDSSNYIDKNILIIELERELGNFKTAKLHLNNLSAEDKKFHNSFIIKSQKHISLKSKKIFRI